MSCGVFSFVGGLVGWLVVVVFFYLEGITLVATILGDEQGKVVGWGGRGSFSVKFLFILLSVPHLSLLHAA